MSKSLIIILLVSGFSFILLKETHAFALTAGDTLCIVNKIEFVGAKHTKEKIIRRELMFQEGDTLSHDYLAIQIEKTRQNLLNTSLFNFVYVDTVFSPGKYSKVEIRYRFVERWYIWPFPVIKMADRNFNSWLLKGSDPERMTYGFYLQNDNFRGKREKLIASYITGYENAFGFSYEIPYLTKQQHIGIIVSTLYEKNHIVPYDTYNNKLIEIKDKSYYLRSSLVTSLRLTFRQGIHNYHYLSFTHNRFEFSDTLLKLNPEYSFKKEHNPEFISISYRFKADFRDFQAYPLKGYYGDFEIIKNGLDLFGNTHLNQLVMKASLRKYWEITPKWHYSASTTSKVNLQQSPPFFLMKGLGYENDFVRGYEYYVVDGEDYFLFRNDVKWTLLNTRVGQIRYIPESVGKIHYTVYLSAFTDLGYVQSKRLNTLNFLANRWLLGTGVGLNIVTYYDKVFRIEVSRNHKNETALFMHFVAPI